MERERGIAAGDSQRLLIAGDSSQSTRVSIQYFLVLVFLWQANSSAYGTYVSGAKRSALMKINGLLNKISTICY